MALNQRISQGARDLSSEFRTRQHPHFTVSGHTEEANPQRFKSSLGETGHVASFGVGDRCPHGVGVSLPVKALLHQGQGEAEFGLYHRNDRAAGCHDIGPCGTTTPRGYFAVDFPVVFFEPGLDDFGEVRFGFERHEGGGLSVEYPSSMRVSLSFLTSPAGIMSASIS